MDMFSGDAAVMHKWLRDQVVAKPGFFYVIEIDDERRIKTIFWADAVMISDFSKFGDFVSFDTTYRTNDTHRPLGIFVGFNHHKCTTVFGAALMYDETAQSFRWVFEKFLKCMNAKLPKTIMTDQALAIALAIRDIFPGVFHALCSWHIDQSPRKRYVDSESEFEFGWQEMLNTCFDEKPTSHHTWLSFIYNFRKLWSSAWVKDAFTAGKTTTQLSEQLNAFARHYLKPSMQIFELFLNFQALVDDLRFNEHNRDFHMQNTIPANNFPNSSLMNHAASLFTPNVFKLIQNEYETEMTYSMEETFDVQHSSVPSFEETMRIFSGSYKLILVQRWEKKDSNDKTLVERELVRLNTERSYIKCSCRFFENHWLMCRHVLRAMEVYGAFGNNEFCRTVPSEFIIGRWTRAFAKPCLPIPDVAKEVEPSTHGKLYLRLYNNTVSLGTNLCYYPEAYSAFMQYWYEGVNVANKMIEDGCSSIAPSRTQCSSALDGEEEYDFSLKLKRRNTDEKERKVRLMSNLETRHLNWKQ